MITLKDLIEETTKFTHPKEARLSEITAESFLLCVNGVHVDEIAQASLFKDMSGYKVICHDAVDGRNAEALFTLNENVMGRISVTHEEQFGPCGTYAAIEFNVLPSTQALQEKVIETLQSQYEQKLKNFLGEMDSAASALSIYMKKESAADLLRDTTQCLLNDRFEYLSESSNLSIA